MRCLTCFSLLLLAVSAVSAEDIVFPPDAGVVDVSKAPYFAKGDGKTDDTDAIQQALLDHPASDKIVYLPDGTYLVSASLRWAGHEDSERAQRATILQGQSRAGTVVRLVDRAPVFGNSGRPRALVWTGEEGDDHVRNAVRNLTLDTGAGNPGAIGLQFAANQQGCVRDVDIIAGGKGGRVGLDLSQVERIGPCWIQRVRIRGFDVGVQLANSLHSVTFEDIELTGQVVAGIRNRGQVVNLRRVTSTNNVPAIQNTDPTGFITLLDSTFQGLPAKRPPAAIQNKGLMFARQISTPGYTNAIENRAASGDNVSGPEVREFVSHPIFNIFPAPQYALYLPIEETPAVPWDPLAAWAGPLANGGKPDDGRDDSAAIQAAIDSGASTVYLPNGTWNIRRTVELRKNVRRLIGCEARLSIDVPGGLPAFKLVEGAAPVVVVERLAIGSAQRLFIEQASARRLVLSSCLGASLSWTGKGDVFLEDVASAAQWIVPAGRKLWARQWSIAVNGTKITNDGGQLWIFGLKTELPGTVVETSNGGKTELLGGLVHATGGWKQDPMFRITDASATLCVSEASFTSNSYGTIVAETRKGLTRRLGNKGPADDQPLPQRVGGIALPLYTGYDGIGAVVPKSLLPAVKSSGN